VSDVRVRSASRLNSGSEPSGHVTYLFDGYADLRYVSSRLPAIRLARQWPMRRRQGHAL
jgi:ribosomal protein L32E